MQRPAKGNTANRPSSIPIRQRESTIDLARSSCTGRLEISWCFVSSVRQGSRGLLLHRHCGAGRSAAYSRGGAAFVRAAEHCHDVHETASLNHISNVFCVMKVADRLNSDLFSSVSTLQITVLFDHRRSHHHHVFLCFQNPVSVDMDAQSPG